MLDALLTSLSSLLLILLLLQRPLEPALLCLLLHQRLQQHTPHHTYTTVENTSGVYTIIYGYKLQSAAATTHTSSYLHYCGEYLRGMYYYLRVQITISGCNNTHLIILTLLWRIPQGYILLSTGTNYNQRLQQHTPHHTYTTVENTSGVYTIIYGYKLQSAAATTHTSSYLHYCGEYLRGMYYYLRVQITISGCNNTHLIILTLLWRIPQGYILLSTGTNYNQRLQQHTPHHTYTIVENTSGVCTIIYGYKLQSAAATTHTSSYLHYCGEYLRGIYYYLRVQITISGCNNTHLIILTLLWRIPQGYILLSTGTNYNQRLQQHTPHHTYTIVENTSGVYTIIYGYKLQSADFGNSGFSGY